MILRIFKCAAIAVIWWYSLPWSIKEMPDSIIEHWQSDRKQLAVLGAVFLSLQTLFLVSLVASAWKFGERQRDGERLFELQHKKLLKHSGVPLLFVLMLSELGWRSRLDNSKQKTGLAVDVGLFLVIVIEVLRFQRREDRKTVYGLHHGRLHLDTHVPMWMNMGYWKANEADPARPKSLAEACRDLLNLVLAEAGFSEKAASSRSRCLIDVGFGCGEQTIHLMSDKPIRPSDKLWWDEENHRVYFDHYVGITQDKAQHQYAQDRADELRNGNVSLLCADASKPWLWSEELFTASRTVENVTQETWLLALDTAYHFSPSRWVLIHHAWRYYGASFMAFDLCLSPTATAFQRIVLRILTTLMGAPWANFVTSEAYRKTLIDLGYPTDNVKIIDISEHVFAPLSEYIEGQGRKLNILGLGLGSFQAAKWLFRWWGETGIVRGVVVIAKHGSLQKSIHRSARKV